MPDTYLFFHLCHRFDKISYKEYSKHRMPLVEAITAEINVPQLDRDIVIMYLLSSMGQLTRAQLVTLAEGLYADIRQGDLKPVAEYIPSFDEVNGRKHIKDPLLRNVVLSYTAEEMEFKIDEHPSLVGDRPRSLDFTLAGDGPARPVLLDTYKLTSSLCAWDWRGIGDETFQPRGIANAWTKTLKILFNNLDPVLQRENKKVIVDVVGSYLMNDKYRKY